MRPENVGSVESAAAGRRAAPHGGREGTEKKEVEQPKSISLSCYRNCPTNGGKRRPEVFGGSAAVHGYEQKLRDLERLLGQKEVEIALLKNFLGEN